MEEAAATAAEATISPHSQPAKPPSAEQSGPSPAAPGSPTPTPMPAPSTAAATTVPSAAPERPPATAGEPITQPGAPLTTAAPAATPTPSAAVAQPAAAGHQQSGGGVKKRKLEQWELQNSTYFKIRATVRDLRPAFLEVRLAPDFRNCKAADEIRRQMKVLLDLSKQLKIEAVSSGNKNIEGQSYVEDRKEAVETRVKVEKQMGGALTGVPNQAGKASNVPEEMTSEAKGLENSLQGLPGTYVVGGSPMGWNFLVYRGSQPVYYGVTKEAYRSSRESGN